MAISSKIRDGVIERAGYRCEYCQTNSRLIGMPLVMEHILPKAAGGKDESENKATLLVIVVMSLKVQKPIQLIHKQVS